MASKEMRELCDRYGISRKTGYKWLHRFEAEGAGGLVDRSRAPRHCEHRMGEAVREALLEVRRRHPKWGPRKLLAWLAARTPGVDWPAACSVGELLRREGLVKEGRRRRRHEPHPGRPQLAAQAPAVIAGPMPSARRSGRKSRGLCPRTPDSRSDPQADEDPINPAGGSHGVGQIWGALRPPTDAACARLRVRVASLQLAKLKESGSPVVAPSGLRGGCRQTHRMAATYAAIPNGPQRAAAACHIELGR